MIKKNIVSLMLKTPEALQRQLSDAITIIGECGHKQEQIFNKGEAWMEVPIEGEDSTFVWGGGGGP